MGLRYRKRTATFRIAEKPGNFRAICEERWMQTYRKRFRNVPQARAGKNFDIRFFAGKKF
jgi:hypothetical protein